MDLFKIEIRRSSDDQVMSTLCTAGADMVRAERVEHGANINLDHASYYTEIVPVPEEEQ
jgi:hypothetical protein